MAAVTGYFGGLPGIENKRPCKSCRTLR